MGNLPFGQNPLGEGTALQNPLFYRSGFRRHPEVLSIFPFYMKMIIC